LLQDDAIVQDQQAVRQAKSFFAVVSHVNDGNLTLMQDGAQFLDELRSQGVVQRPKRFIEHEQVWGWGKRARQSDTLLLPARKVGNGAVSEALHANAFQTDLHAP